MPEDSTDVMRVVTEQVETRFGKPVTELRQAVAASPHADAKASGIVYWYDLLTEAQAVVERAENQLVEALGSQPDVLDDAAMELAQQVNSAVAVRDGRAIVVQFLLDPKPVGRRGSRAGRGAIAAPRRAPALSTTPPVVPKSGDVPVRGAAR